MTLKTKKETKILKKKGTCANRCRQDRSIITNQDERISMDYKDIPELPHYVYVSGSDRKLKAKVHDVAWV